MKIKKDSLEYQTLLASLYALPRENVTAHVASIRKEYAEKHANNPRRDAEKRIRWDLFRAACPVSFRCSFYSMPGVNDSHIDTALKAAVAELNLA